MTPSQPDFLLQCDDVHIKPLAIFTDGFEYHCSPNNRLADDLHKRRAILESGNYLVWSVTWDDLIKVLRPRVWSALSRLFRWSSALPMRHVRTGRRCPIPAMC